jgi:uncharacterized membrane protein
VSEPNPYAAPKAPVADADAGPRNFIPAGRAVPAAHGWNWIAEGWELFKRQPLLWIAFAIAGMVMFIVLFFAMRLLGQLILMLLVPVFVGGVMIGCRDLEQGRELRLAHLFAGFRERFGGLVSVGLISLAVAFAIVLVFGLVAGASVLPLLGGGTDPAALAAAGLTMLLALLVLLALMMPLAMATWFAPQLVVFDAQGPGEAMKNSFMGCLKNIGPFLIYGVIFFLLAIAASIPFGLGWLVLGPVLACSLYASYRDIFFD